MGSTITGETINIPKPNVAKEAVLSYIQEDINYWGKVERKNWRSGFRIYFKPVEKKCLDLKIAVCDPALTTRSVLHSSQHSFVVLQNCPQFAAYSLPTTLVVVCWPNVRTLSSSQQCTLPDVMWCTGGFVVHGYGAQAGTDLAETGGCRCPVGVHARWCTPM